MRHPKALRWVQELKEVFRRIDERLEDDYGDRYAKLHTMLRWGKEGAATVAQQFACATQRETPVSGS